jgi:predicted ATP-dependent endonuclease of OLD family
METLSKFNSLGKESSVQGVINNFNDYIVCKVKFSAFAEYENICFLPNYFSELVKIFSKAFYPNDFSVIYLDSQYQQHSIHSDETYNEILDQLNNSEEKDIKSIKFQIILHNVNKEEFKKKEKIGQITQTIKYIFELEKRNCAEMLNKAQIDNNINTSTSKSIDDNNNLVKAGSFYSNVSLGDNNNNNSISYSCKGFENRRIESFKIAKKDFSFVDTINIESLSDCSKNLKNPYSRILKENKKSGKNNSGGGKAKNSYKESEVQCY